MIRLRLPLLLPLALLVFSCSGGSSSPTEPAGPSSLTGTWSGSISGTSAGVRFDCSIEVELVPANVGAYVGGWTADCAGTHLAGPAAAASLAGVQILSGAVSSEAPADQPLAKCGWGAPVIQRGLELSGTWQPSDNCTDSTISGGPLKLTLVG